MPENWTELELAELCAKRSTSAENELYKRYAARLNGVCLRYLDADDAKDMVHDVLIKALESIGSFKYKGNGSLYAWMRRIAVNSILDRLKKRRLAFISLDKVSEQAAEEPEENLLKEIPASKLLEFISALPEGRRAVFNLYCIDGYSHEEISKMLNISSKGSAAVLAKARNQLKKVIYNYLQAQR